MIDRIKQLTSNPYEALLYSVIFSAIRDKDIRYLNGRNFEHDCGLLGLETNDQRELIAAHYKELEQVPKKLRFLHENQFVSKFMGKQ